MRKIKIFLLAILCVLFLPGLAHAEECRTDNVNLESVELLAVTGSTKEASPASVVDNKVNLDLKMFSLGDAARYKVVVKNTSEADYRLSKNDFETTDGYIKYSIEIDDEDAVVKPNQVKEVTLLVEYAKEVDGEKFIDNKYLDDSQFTFCVSKDNTEIIENAEGVNKEEPKTVDNPQTGSHIVRYVVIAVIASGIVVLIGVKAWRKSKYIIPIVIAVALIPVGAYATCKASIGIESRVEISKVDPDSCNYDGALIMGAEFVKGNFTYRYKQEGNYTPTPVGPILRSINPNVTNGDNIEPAPIIIGGDNNNGWLPLFIDGWGVKYTPQAESTADDNKMCTEINEKPIVSMSYMFSGSNVDESTKLDLVDMSKVVNMTGTFAFTNATPDNLDNFDTTNVRHMNYMFSNNSAPSLDVSNFNTANVVNMSFMFNNAGADYEDWTLEGVEKLNTSNVEDMSSMFANVAKRVKTFELDLSGWNTSKVTNMQRMFAAAGRNATEWTLGDLSGWDTSNVINMSDMFYEAGYKLERFDMNLSNWNVSKVENMSDMFSNAGYSADTFSLNLAGWNTGNVTNMVRIFSSLGRSAGTFNLDVSGWNTSNVTNMGSAFGYAGYDANDFELDLSDWDTKNVRDMGYMLQSVGYKAKTWNVKGLSEWDTSKVQNMEWMLALAGYSASSFELDLSNWDVANVTKMTSAFDRIGYSATMWSIGDLSGWDTGKVTDMDYAFQEAGYSARTWSIGDLSGWNMGNVKYMTFTFSNAGHNSKEWSIGNISGWDVSKVTKLFGTFKGAGYNANNFELDLSGWDTKNVTNMDRLFEESGFNARTWNVKGLSTLNTSKVTSIWSMFYRAGYGANNFELDLSGWDTRNVTNMFMTFREARSVKTIYVGDGFDTSKVTNSTNMFYGASSLVGGNGTRYDWDHTDIDYARVDTPETPGYFTKK